MPKRDRRLKEEIKKSLKYKKKKIIKKCDFEKGHGVMKKAQGVT
jgi:hypothetical protein